MINFFLKKKDEYPTLTTRLFAAILDCTIVVVILYPIQSFIMGLFYSVPPNQEISELIAQAGQNSKTFSELLFNLKQNPAMQNFIESGKLKVLIFNQIFQFCVLVFYVLLFWIKYQATPGKMLISAKIVDSQTLGKPTVIQFIIRLLSYAISLLPLFLGFFIIPLNKHRRGFHDFISNTMVISTKKNEK